MPIRNMRHCLMGGTEAEVESLLSFNNFISHANSLTRFSKYRTLSLRPLIVLSGFLCSLLSPTDFCPESGSPIKIIFSSPPRLCFGAMQSNDAIKIPSIALKNIPVILSSFHTIGAVAKLIVGHFCRCSFLLHANVSYADRIIARRHYPEVKGKCDPFHPFSDPFQRFNS